MAGRTAGANATTEARGLTRNAPGSQNDSVDVQAVLATLRSPQRSRKYRNQPVTVDGHRFDSKAEAERYEELRGRFRDGEIDALEIHPHFPLVVHGQNCGDYIADFAYLDLQGNRVIEDVKSAATRKLSTYRLKARLVWALYGLRIQEIT